MKVLALALSSLLAVTEVSALPPVYRHNLNLRREKLNLNVARQDVDAASASADNVGIEIEIKSSTTSTSVLTDPVLTATTPEDNGVAETISSSVSFSSETLIAGVSDSTSVSNTASATISASSTLTSANEDVDETTITSSSAPVSSSSPSSSATPIYNDFGTISSSSSVYLASSTPVIGGGIFTGNGDYEPSPSASPSSSSNVIPVYDDFGAVSSSLSVPSSTPVMGSGSGAFTSNDEPNLGDEEPSPSDNSISTSITEGTNGDAMGNDNGKGADNGMGAISNAGSLPSPSAGEGSANVVTTTVYISGCSASDSPSPNSGASDGEEPPVFVDPLPASSPASSPGSSPIYNPAPSPAPVTNGDADGFIDPIPIPDQFSSPMASYTAVYGGGSGIIPEVNPTSSAVASPVSSPVSSHVPSASPSASPGNGNATGIFPGTGGGVDGTTYRSMAYFVNWAIYARKHNPQDLPARHLTHILYAFANIRPETGEVYLSDTYSDLEKHYETDSWEEPATNNAYGCVKQLYLLKKQNRHLKVLLSIGGWTYSKNFVQPAATEKGRKEFARSAVKLMGDLGMDGLDIDWEYPEDDTQATNFVSLLAETRAELDRYATETSATHPFLLSIASPAGPSKFNKLHLAEMDAHLSFWNLMAYDYSGSWDTITGHNANLFASTSNPASTPFNTHTAITAYIEAGIAPGKINLGMPLYGRSFAGTEGPGTKFSDVGGMGSFENGIWDYKVLPKEGAIVKEDEETGASFSFDEAKKELISFDNVATIKRKAEYVIQNRLGGGMWWESSGDREVGSGGSLIETLVDSLGGVNNLDSSENQLEYPSSRFENLRKGFA